MRMRTARRRGRVYRIAPVAASTYNTRTSPLGVSTLMRYEHATGGGALNRSNRLLQAHAPLGSRVRRIGLRLELLAGPARPGGVRRGWQTREQRESQAEEDAPSHGAVHRGDDR
jgi:hypothetical protein